MPAQEGSARGGYASRAHELFEPRGEAAWVSGGGGHGWLWVGEQGVARALRAGARLSLLATKEAGGDAPRVREPYFEPHLRVAPCRVVLIRLARDCEDAQPTAFPELCDGLGVSDDFHHVGVEPRGV